MKLSAVLGEVEAKTVQDGITQTAVQSQDTLILIIVVAVLSTLLMVVVLGCISWLCFKCCIQSVWFLKPRRWPRQPENMTFPPPQRDVVEMMEMRHNQNSAAEFPGVKNHAYVSERFGISDRLGYGHTNRKAAVPYLPPPKTWTPSPPFPPGGAFPAAPHPKRPNPSLMNFQNIPSESEYVQTQKRQCQQCGTVQLCPTELERRLNELRLKSRRSFKRAKFTMDNLASSKNSALRPPHNTPAQEFDCNNINSASKRRHVSEGDSTYDEFQEDNVNANLEPLVHQSRHNLGHSSKSYVSEDFGRSTSRKSFSQPEIVPPVLTAGRPSFNVAPVDATVVKSSGNRQKRRESLKARKREVPPNVAVFIESPSPSSSSSTDLTTILNRPQKPYWKLYHGPKEDEDQNEGGQGDSEEGDIKVGDENDCTSDATPSMSWDHLTPDPSPIILSEEAAKSRERVTMSMSSKKSVYYSVNKGNPHLVAAKDYQTQAQAQLIEDQQKAGCTDTSQVAKAPANFHPLQ